MSDTAGNTPDVKENEVMIYPKIYADYQQTSFQSQTARISGKRIWFVNFADNVKGQKLQLIILTDTGLTVQYESRLMQLDFNGQKVWDAACDPVLPVVASGKRLYFRGLDGDFHGIDEQGREMFEEFPIPNCFALGGVSAVMPTDDGNFVFQTYNNPREVEEGYPPEKSDYNLILTGPTDDIDWKWLHQFEGQALPGVASTDRTKFILLNDQSEVMVFDILKGELARKFTVEGASFVDVSIDRRDNLIAKLKTIEGERKLCSFTLSGELNWEYILPPGTGWSQQPPAVDSNNRVYVIDSDSLLVIDEGELKWQQAVPVARMRYLTILGDNSVLVVGGIEVDHFDSEGKELLSVELEEGDIITAPPVIDNKGRLYIGTVSGIHCLE
jgi:outer membrane protein assembly factor BamB